MKQLVIFLSILLIPLTLSYGATEATIDVTAVLQGFTMTLSVTDIQMTGKSGGTSANGTLEFGSISVLSNNKYATCPEVLKIDWDPQNNAYYISVYMANSNANYNVSKFKDNIESGYWDEGAEANGLVGTNNPDYVAAMMWSCNDDNISLNLSDASIADANWTYLKDYYTHLGESATGIILATNSGLNLSSRPNYSDVTTAGNRPMETWTYTWERNYAYGTGDINHWVQRADATGYRKILYGTASSSYTISTKTYDEPNPETDKTVYFAIGASFDGKPAQAYGSENLIVEILNE